MYSMSQPLSMSGMQPLTPSFFSIFCLKGWKHLRFKIILSKLTYTFPRSVNKYKCELVNVSVLNEKHPWEKLLFQNCFISGLSYPALSFLKVRLVSLSLFFFKYSQFLILILLRVWLFFNISSCEYQMSVHKLLPQQSFDIKKIKICLNHRMF